MQYVATTTACSVAHWLCVGISEISEQDEQSREYRLSKHVVPLKQHYSIEYMLRRISTQNQTGTSLYDEERFKRAFAQVVNDIGEAEKAYVGATSTSAGRRRCAPDSENGELPLSAWEQPINGL